MHVIVHICVYTPTYAYMYTYVHIYTDTEGISLQGFGYVLDHSSDLMRNNTNNKKILLME